MCSIDESAVRGSLAFAKSTGRRIEDTEIHLWTFAKDGSVAAFRHFLDTLQQAEALRG